MITKGLTRTLTCGEITKSNLYEEVTICGWVHAKRDLGGLSFIDLRDKYGIVQLNISDVEDLTKNITLESVLQIEGKVQMRPSAARNPNMPTGAVEVKVSKLTLLSKADIPFSPFAKVNTSEETKLRYRYLDLRNFNLQDILKLRSEVFAKLRNILVDEGFVEVETPMLFKSTPEGARDFLVPSRLNKGKVYALPQSPQLLKQLLMIAGVDRYYQICKCFRDEDLRADRQLEFTQLDIEASFIDEQFIEELIKILIKALFPFYNYKRMPYSEAMCRFGSDKPDDRFGLEHLDLTFLKTSSDFEKFKTATLIKGIFLEKSTLSRKEIEELAAITSPFTKDLFWVKIENGTLAGGVAKFLNTEDYQSYGDGLLLIIADMKESSVHAAANALRLHLGHKLNLIQDMYSFIWVYDFPLFEWNDEENRFVAKHHPFTSPKNKDEFLSGNNPASLVANAYDIVCNGEEIGGGSIRIYDQIVQKKMFEYLGLDENSQKEQFSFFLDALKSGVPPHGGIALGLDRLIMIMSKTNNIKDVIAFPKTTSGLDLMAQTPSFVPDKQFKDLGITIS